MKYAVVDVQGTQVRVREGDRVVVNRFPRVAEGEEIVLDRVLMLRDGDAVDVGTPYVNGVRVVARVVRHLKGKKVWVFKFKKRKNYRVLRGHRQPLSEVEIVRIERGG